MNSHNSVPKDLELVTDTLIQLSQDTSHWYSTFSIPIGDEYLDISCAARGSMLSSTPSGATNQPDIYPTGRNASCYMLDQLTFGEDSWDSLKSVITKVGCVSQCHLEVRKHQKESNPSPKASIYFVCSHGLKMKDKSASVYAGDDIGKSSVKKEHMKRTKSSGHSFKGTHGMVSKSKKRDIIKSNKASSHKHWVERADHRRRSSARAPTDAQICPMKIRLFHSHDNKWNLHKDSCLQHSFHPPIDDSAQALGEKDLLANEKKLASASLFVSFLS
jgi:hypothetical protein